MAANPDLECVSAVIKNDGGSLGIAIMGGTSTMGPGVYISEISPNGAVGKAGKIKPNDLVRDFLTIPCNVPAKHLLMGSGMRMQGSGERHIRWILG